MSNPNSHRVLSLVLFCVVLFTSAVIFTILRRNGSSIYSAPIHRVSLLPPLHKDRAAGGRSTNRAVLRPGQADTHSDDGQWLDYCANSTGAIHIHPKRCPNINENNASLHGRPTWSPTGRRPLSESHRQKGYYLPEDEHASVILTVGGGDTQAVEEPILMGADATVAVELSANYGMAFIIPKRGDDTRRGLVSQDEVRSARQLFTAQRTRVTLRALVRLAVRTLRVSLQSIVQFLTRLEAHA